MYVSQTTVTLFTYNAQFLSSVMSKNVATFNPPRYLPSLWACGTRNEMDVAGRRDSDPESFVQFEICRQSGEWDLSLPFSVAHDWV